MITNFWHNLKCLINGDVENIVVDSGLCKCGKFLPSVKPDEIPFEFCSQVCKDYFSGSD